MATKNTFSGTRKFDLNSLKTKVKESAAGKKSYKDEREWKLTRGKDDTGSATIRFLPGHVEDKHELPFVLTYDHSFQGPGGYYIEHCPTTIGLDCPLCQANSKLYNSGVENDKKIASPRKRKKVFISNVLVLSDPANPANEGKVFLYKYGTKVFDMINSAMSPQFADEKALNPFALDGEGASFTLKARKVDGQITYDKSKFNNPEEIALKAADLDKVLVSQYHLSEFLDTAHFKTFEQLSAKLTKVLGGTSGSATVEKDLDNADLNSKLKATGRTNPKVVEAISGGEELPAGEGDESLADLQALIGGEEG